MGKRSRSKKESAGCSSENSSKQASPAQSDSDTNDTPPSKKAKTNNGTKKGPKSSAQICELYDLNDVDMEYTDADYQNLTNYGLFVRMVRPQMAAANPKITSSRMVQLMEAKWREFRESNPLTKKRNAERGEGKVTPQINLGDKFKLSDRKDSSSKKKKDSTKKAAKKPKIVIQEDSSDDDKTEEDADEVSEEDLEDEEDFETPKRSNSRRSGGGLKIRLPLMSPKTQSGKKDKKKDRRRSKKRSEIVYEDEDEDVTPKRSSRHGTPSSSRRPSESDDDAISDDVGSDDNTSSRSSRSQPKRKSRGSKKVVDESLTSEEEESASEEEVKSTSKRSKSRRVKEVKERDDSYEEDDYEEDEELDSDGEKKKKKKRRSETPQIPGERKSERSRKVISRVMSDKDFEKMLKEDVAAKKKKEKKEKEKEKKVKLHAKSRKGYWQAEDEDASSNDEKEGKEKKDIDEADDHYWYCEKCQDGGDLLLCDTCPKSWHKDCAKIEGEIPDGDWSCPKCTGEYQESEPEEEDDHDLYCKECKDGGDVLLCDFCRFVYHPKCVNPPLVDIPDGEWKCPRCTVADEPLKGRIRKVLFWRWSKQLSGADELDHTQSPLKKAQAQAAEEEQKEKEAHGATPVKRPERLFFCRFEYYSYWDCEWVSEIQIEVHHPIMLHSLKRKFDFNEPPALEDGSSWGRQRRKARTEEDPHNLEEKYYRYGIKPDWLQIHRIIDHEGREGSKNTRYLVKWRDLGYEECTWETTTELPEGLEDWDKHYKAYWEHRKEKMRSKDSKKKPKKALLRQKWEKQPDYITATGGKLHPYQLEGVNWMRFSYSQDTNIILADEMGLGKTIQAITILYTLWKEGFSKGPFLISAPLSTVPNWEREFEFWAPEMYVMTYTGHKEARTVMREHEFSYDDAPFAQYAKPSKLRSDCRVKFDVLLTSYEMVNMDNTTLASINWEVLVVDEAHRLKSQASLFFQTLSKYKIAYKLLLTGTPLQNNLEELFNLLKFLEPKTFSDMDSFLDEFADINKDEQVTRLHEMLAPHMLRRLKLDVLTDLPTKSEFIVRIELSDMQKKFYKHILTKNYEALNVKGYANSTSLINIMMDLRKCCNHPYLFPAAEKEAPINQQGMYEGSALIKACGKLELMSKMLRILREGKHRVLIFSQMTRCLDVLEDFLAFEGFGYERIDGSVNGKLRQESIDRFNDPQSDSFAFLLSTKAGGLGINLATADTVVIYDMDWNPHNDIQAFSRAHRIGQKNRVMIYRFVSRNTVEERITEVAKKKMMLTELVIHRGMGSSEKSESLSKKEVSEILKFGAEDLFKDDSEGKVVWTDDAVTKLLDRTQEGDNPDAHGEKEAVMGMNEYLRSFKVASYHTKETEEEEPPAEEVEEKEEEREKEDEQDPEYWSRVLGSAYTEHKLQQLQQEEELARSLGKGKRTRRQVNYAEIVLSTEATKDQLAKQAAQNKQGKRSLEPDVAEPEPDEIEEEAKYMSDYEPEEDDSSEEEEEGEEGGSDQGDEEWKEPKINKVPPKPETVETKKRGRPNKPIKPASSELPPLLAKVNGHTEVLGFTSRQRRAFLDAVMRYGMPPDDGHQSQWLVRDLRNKTDKVFRAYVSLFMRHLCEPVGEDIEKFSDGVPREGLSRQHVLTRIGILALIRRKVQEFEKKNGTDSMSDYKKRRAQIAASAANPIVISDTNGVNGKKGDKLAVKGESKEENSKGKEETDKEKEKPGEQDKEADSKAVKEEKPSVDTKDGDDKKEEPKEEKDVKSDVKEEVKKEDIETNEDVKEEDPEQKEKKKEAPSTEETDMEVEESEPAENIPQVDGAGDDKEEKDTSEMDKKEFPEKADKKSSEEDMDVDESADKDVSSKDAETKEGDGKGTDAKTNKDEKDNEDNESSKDAKTKGDQSDEGAKVEKEQVDAEDDESTKNEKEKEEKDKKAVSSNKDKDGTDTKEKTEAKVEAEKGDADVKKPDATKDSKKEGTPKKDGASEKDDPKMKIVVDLRKQAWELRRMFYIADGGFTELHALWQYEEQQLRPGREYETWHRRHDYWLLAGIVTHGYRHWQDILNDPRFEMLNRAFQSDAEKMRKAAFLNRRFQLLEQALVIEEQLHKAVQQSSELQKQLRKNCRGEIDAYSELDQLAILLRQIARRGATQDPHLAKVLAQLESLVGDIKHSTNTVVPATLARAPGVVVRQNQHQRPVQMLPPRVVRPSGQQAMVPNYLLTQRRNTPSPNPQQKHTVITLE